MAGSYAPVSLEEDHRSGLDENLVGPSPGTTLPDVVSRPLMQVVAPADLPEGYEFQASMGQRRVKVVVPVGGVERGQRFEVDLPPDVDSHLTGISVPVGHWRDSLLALFQYGACHPHCWAACCCHLLAAGQVIRRLHLNWMGRAPTNPGQAASAFIIILGVVCAYFAVYIALYATLIYLVEPDTNYNPSTAFTTTAYIFKFWQYLYWILTTYVLYNLRKYTRTKYAIPASDLEDCCCACWCPCLVAGQLLRHTTDYSVYPATCCTERGIPKSAPEIV